MNFDYFFSNPAVFVVVAIILVCGWLGGFASIFLENATEQPTRYQKRRGILLGVIAAMSVPLLLQLVSSNLLEEAMVQGKSHKFFVFAAYCAIVAVFADRFLKSLGDSILQRLNEVEKKAETAKSTAEEASATATTADVKADAAMTGVSDEEIFDGAATDNLLENEGGEASSEEESTEKESFSLDAPASKKDVKRAPKSIKKSPSEKVWAALTDKKVKLRTAKGIAKEADLAEIEVAAMLAALEKTGRAKHLTKRDGTEIWMAQ